MDHPIVHLNRAAYVLAIGPGDVRSRLKDAYYSLALVQQEHLPPELRKDFEWVMKSLTKPKARHSQESDLDMTLHYMQNRTGARIAQRILYIQTRLQEFLEAGLLSQK